MNVIDSSAWLEFFADAANARVFARPIRDFEQLVVPRNLWARGYWVASSRNVTDEVWKKYIEDQKSEEPDDDFRVL